MQMIACGITTTGTIARDDCGAYQHTQVIDIESGKTVWQAKLPAGGQATPMTYEENGRQYLVIMAGGHHFHGDAGRRRGGRLRPAEVRPRTPPGTFAVTLR